MDRQAKHLGCQTVDTKHCQLEGQKSNKHSKELDLILVKASRSFGKLTWALFYGVCQRHLLIIRDWNGDVCKTLKLRSIESAGLWISISSSTVVPSIVLLVIGLGEIRAATKNPSKREPWTFWRDFQSTGTRICQALFMLFSCSKARPFAETSGDTSVTCRSLGSNIEMLVCLKLFERTKWADRTGFR